MDQSTWKYQIWRYHQKLDTFHSLQESYELRMQFLQQHCFDLRQMHVDLVREAREKRWKRTSRYHLYS